MAFANLRAFVRRLEKEGELVRIETPVSNTLEISAISDRVSKGPAAQNKALFFEHVDDGNIPVLTNMFGNEKRMALALNVKALDDLNCNLAKLITPELPKGLGPTVGKALELFGALRSVGLKPKMVRKAPVQDIVYTGDEIDLNLLPILQCWPQDGGRFITLPTVITRDPVSGVRNVGMYRLQQRDRRTLGMHWQLHKGGAEHQRKALERGIERIPVAVSLGGDPAIIWSGSAPLPPDIDEFMLAGWLRGKPVSLVSAITQPLEVPAEAEFVIEGYVDPAESAPEGPFGDHTGYYTPVADYPVLHVTAISHRRQPIYPATIVGRPPMEDYWMGKATERLFLPLVRLFLPEIVDMNMPAAGVFHNLVVVSVRKRYPGHVRKVINGLWGLALMALTKGIVVVDADVNVQDNNEVAWQVLGNVDWARDIVVQEGPVDALDHASYRFAYGGKIGVDATAKDERDGYRRGWPEKAVMSDDIEALVEEKWASYGLG